LSMSRYCVSCLASPVNSQLYSPLRLLQNTGLAFAEEELDVITACFRCLTLQSSKASYFIIRSVV